MAKHAVLSPSSAKRWMTCPGSVALSEGIVEPPSSYADEGTAAHFLASVCLSEVSDAKDFIGAGIELCYHDGSDDFFERWQTSHKADYLAEAEIEVLNQFEVDDDMARYVQVYLDYVRDLVKSTNGELFVEVSVPLTHITGEEDARGTSDAVIIAGDEIIVVDLKYGRGNEVSAEANEQLMMYASGAMQEFALAGDFKRVRCAISQPRITSAPSEWGCTVEELMVFEESVSDAASDVNALVEGTYPEGRLCYNPSEDACRWCKAKATCPALSQFVQDEVGADFEVLLTSPSPAKLASAASNDGLALKMACLDLIEDWCKAIRSKVETELLAGNDVPGWKLVQGRKGARAWTNKEEAEAAMKAMRLKKDEMYDFSLISPTTAEKVAAITPKRWATLQPLIKQTEGKPSVAPVTDKRPALSLTPVADDFSALPAA